MKFTAYLGMVMGFVLTAAMPAAASTTTFSTSGTLNGLPESASAVITTGANTLTIVLNNLIINPTSAVQDLSGFQFSLSSGQTVATLTSSSAYELTFVGNAGDYAIGANPVSTLWGIQSVSAAIKLSDLGFNAPKHTIIGAPDANNKYSNANPSLTGSSHQPELSQTATFVLSVTGVTAATTVNSAIFQFNTDAGYTLNGTLTPNAATPEPATFALMAGGLGLAAYMKRKRSRA